LSKDIFETANVVLQSGSGLSTSFNVNKFGHLFFYSGFRYAEFEFGLYSHQHFKRPIHTTDIMMNDARH